MNEPFISIFLFVFVFGAIGGFLNAMQSPKTHTICIPRFKKTRLKNKNQQKQDADNKDLINMGIFGFLLSGGVAGLVLVGSALSLTDLDISPLYDNETLEERVEIPKELLSQAHEEHFEDIQKLMALTYEHNSKIDPDASNKAQSVLTAWFNLFILGITGGFAGLALITAFSDKFLKEIEAQVDKLEHQVEQEQEQTINNKIEHLLRRAREMIESKDYSQAKQLCDEILAIEPTNARALANKARALRWEGKIDDAIKILEKTLSQSDIDNYLRGRILLNQACYQKLKMFPDSLAETPDADQQKALKVIETTLKAAIECDGTLRHKLETDEDIKGFKGQKWFDDLVQ